MAKKTFILSNQEKIHPTDCDLEMLLFIYQHRLVTFQQVENFTSGFTDITSNAIRRKLKRWSAKNVVICDYYRIGRRGFNIILYRLGREGITILAKAALIKERDNHNSLFFPTKNLEHWFGVQDVVSKIENQLIRSQITYTSLLASENPYLDHDSPVPVSLIIPDWIIQTEKGLLNIELDKGTEILGTIQKKVQKYSKLARQNPNSNYFVLFISMDDSVTYRNEYGSNKSRRIAGIRDTILRTHGWQQPNLSYFVTSSTRAPDIGMKILTGTYPIAPRMNEALIDMATNLWINYNKCFPYAVTPDDKESYYPKYVESNLYAEGHLVLTHNEIELSKHMAIVVLEEGSVSSWDRIRYLNVLAKEMKFKKPMDGIIALYSSKDELEKDVISERMEHVFFGFNELWIEQVEKSPRFYQNTAPYRKEMIRFE